MKKNYLLVSLAIGFVVFLFTWGATPTNNFNAIKLFVIIFGTYKGMNYVFGKEYNIAFKTAFKVGFQIVLYAGILAFILYYVAPNSSGGYSFTSEKLISALDAFIAILIIGTITASVTSIKISKRKLL